jgi:hypothetical protein
MPMSEPIRAWVSESSVEIRNAILDALVEIDLKPRVDKSFINLSLGDPTKNPELQPHNVSVDAVADAVRSGKFNGEFSRK